MSGFGRSSGAVRGVALVEFIIVLPLFVTMIFGIILFSTLYRNHTSGLRALSEASNAFSGITALGGFDPTIPFERAGIVMMEEAARLRLGVDHLKIGEYNGQPYVLLGLPHPFTVENTAFPADPTGPLAYELRARYNNVWPLGFADFAALAVIEGSLGVGNPPLLAGQAYAYFPEAAAGSRVNIISLP